MRIIGGGHRRRRLVSLVNAATRPTADHTREMIFNILLHGCLSLEKGLGGMRVLDVFAGTGALGFEALSRGATHATFVEKNAHAMAGLQKNGVVLNEQDRMMCYSCDIFSLPLAKIPCDLIFLDPPYHQNLTEPALESLQKKGWIQPKAWIIAEGPAGEELRLPAEYILKTHRTSGPAEVHFFQYGTL